MASENMKTRYDARATRHDFHEGDETSQRTSSEAADQLESWCSREGTYHRLGNDEIWNFTCGPFHECTWNIENPNRADGGVQIWSQPHESMDSTCQQGIVQAFGGSVMVWGMYSWRDMGPLIRLDTTLTGDRYVSFLSDHLHPFMSIVHSDGLGEFQQDNATLLTFGSATE
ncbi:transposable element Tcb2 transposase [Trichonephila clavipes]|nr:transposable element Tcb2 transposase [Trichonephila clavipes]